MEGGLECGCDDVCIVIDVGRKAGLEFRRIAVIKVREETIPVSVAAGREIGF